MEHPELWTALLEECDRLSKRRVTEVPSSRGVGMIHSRSGSNFAAMSVLLRLSIRDDVSGKQTGECAAYLITAHRSQGRPITVSHQRFVDSSEAYWTEQLAHPERRAVIDGIHYRIGDERRPKDIRGMGGRSFDLIRLEDNQLVTTTDLWYQGPIPPMFRDQLPDTHRFATTEEVMP